MQRWRNTKGRWSRWEGLLRETRCLLNADLSRWREMVGRVVVGGGTVTTTSLVSCKTHLPEGTSAAL